jgi:hypothetical protein
MPIPGYLLTTAMVVMPHTDVDRALEVAFSRISFSGLNSPGSTLKASGRNTDCYEICPEGFTNNPVI